MEEFWNSKTVDTTEQPAGPTQEQLDTHLGNRSNFVGVMDTPEKVQQHLDEVAKFEAVRLAELAELGVPVAKLEPEQWFDCGQCSSPHGACLSKCVKGAQPHQCTIYQQAGAEPGDVTDPPAFLADTGDPAMDAALVADQLKLEALGAFGQSNLVECDSCPTSGGCVGTCMKANWQPARQPYDADQHWEGMHEQQVLKIETQPVFNRYGHEPNCSIMFPNAEPVCDCRANPLVLAAQRATPHPGAQVVYASNPTGPGHALAQAWPQQGQPVPPAPGQPWQAADQVPQEQALAAAKAAKRARVEQARQAWRDAVAKRAELVRQWDEYIRHLKAEFQRARDDQ